MIWPNFAWGWNMGAELLLWAIWLIGFVAIVALICLTAGIDEEPGSMPPNRRAHP